MDITSSENDNIGRRVRAMSAPTAAKEWSRQMAQDDEEGPHKLSNYRGHNESHGREARPSLSSATSNETPAYHGDSRELNTLPEPTLPPVRDIVNNSDIPRETLSNYGNFTRNDGFISNFTPINGSSQSLTQFQTRQARSGSHIGDNEAFSQRNPQPSYVSPSTYLGDDARLIARRPSVPVLRISPPSPEGSSSFRPREHKMTQKILQKTAKCDYCNQRNTSVLLKCQECPTAVCRTCVENGKLDNSPTHRVKKEDRDSLDWDPNTGPRAAGFRSKRRTNDQNNRNHGNADDDRSSWESHHTQSISRPPQESLSVGGDAVHDSDDEEWTPNAPSRKRSLPKQAKRPRGRPRKESLSIDDDNDEEEVDQASSKRPRWNSDAAAATPGSGSSARSIALDEESATAASYRPIRQTALSALDRAYVGASHEGIQSGTSTRSKDAADAEQIPHDITEPGSLQHSRPDLHETGPEARKFLSTNSDVSRPLPARPSSPRFISTPRNLAHLPNMEQRRNPPAGLPPPAPVHPPLAPQRFAEPGAVPRGTFPRPRYGSTIPGTWQPPLWTSNGVDWDKQRNSPTSTRPDDHGAKPHTSATPPSTYSAYMSNHAVEDGYSLPPIRGASQPYQVSYPPASASPGQPPISQPRPYPLPPLHYPATLHSGYYSSASTQRPRESAYTGHVAHRYERPESSTRNDRDVLDASATLAGMRSSLPANPEPHRPADGKEHANKTTQTDDYLMDLDR